jgi:hypothetical protein
MKKITYATLSALTISLAIFACKKEDKKDDTTPQNVAPTVAITFPQTQYGYVIEGSDTTLTITANASDSDGSITKVEFYVDDVKVGEDVTAPYSYAHVFSVRGNSYPIKAIAKDDDGATTTSTVVWTGVDN